MRAAGRYRSLGEMNSNYEPINGVRTKSVACGVLTLSLMHSFCSRHKEG